MKKLEQLKEKHTNIVFEEMTEIGAVKIDNLWEDKTLSLLFDLEEDIDFLEELIFPKGLSAIFHTQQQEYEFIFTPIEPEYHAFSRAFTFIFEGVEFKSEFREPSCEFVKIAKAFREKDMPSNTNYRNLRQFRDFYRKDDENVRVFIKEYFANKKALNFFVSGDFAKFKDHRSLLNHLDFIMSYYDRKTPQIDFFNETDCEVTTTVPCLLKSSKFPDTVSLNQIDDVVLNLLQVAKQPENNVRLKYIFYFQALEYCAYYFMSHELKRKLKNIVRNPDILSNVDKYAQTIIEEFKDNFKSNDDSQKLEHLIYEYIKIEDIQCDIDANIDFFEKDIEFEGGLKMEALLKKGGQIKDKELLKKIKANIEKIRNVLVHVRESRENKVILPTPANDQLILPYLYLIRRIAEIIAFRFSN